MTAAVASVLDRAADRLERTGWTGTCTEDAEGRCCAAVALCDGNRNPDWSMVSAAENALKAHLGITSIINWNDAPGRTAVEVIEALRAAARISRGEDREGSPEDKWDDPVNRRIERLRRHLDASWFRTTTLDVTAARTARGLRLYCSWLVAARSRAETARERLASAAYCLDRADQYATSSPIWIALADAAEGIAKGEARAALDRGETEDLLERCAKLAGKETT